MAYTTAPDPEAEQIIDWCNRCENDTVQVETPTYYGPPILECGDCINDGPADDTYYDRLMAPPA